MKKGFCGNYIVVAICFFCIFPMIVMGLFCRPLADDYGACLQTHPALKNGGGFFELLKAAAEHVVLFYQSWQGVYTSEFLFSLHPGLFNEKYYIATPLIFTIIPLVLTNFIIRIINRLILKEASSFTWALTFVLVLFYLAWLPHPNEGLYWYSGAINYLPWLFLSILCNLLLVEIYVSEKELSESSITIIICCVCCFLISGAHLSVAFENVLLVTFLEIFFIFKKKMRIGVFPLLVGWLFFLVNILAPGTAIRRTYFTGQPFIKCILLTLERAYYNIVHFTTIHILILLVIISPVAFRIAIVIKKSVTLKTVLVVSGVCLIVWCGVIAMPFYSMSNWGDDRYINLVWANYVFMIMAIYTLFISWLYKTTSATSLIEKIDLYNKKHAVFVVCIGIILFVFLPSANIDDFDKTEGYVKESAFSNSIKACIEICNGSAAQYAKEQDERIQLFNDDTVEEVVVNYLTQKPYLLYISDLSSDPNIFPNTSISRYYGKKSVIAH